MFSCILCCYWEIWLTVFVFFLSRGSAFFLLKLLEFFLCFDFLKFSKDVSEVWLLLYLTTYVHSEYLQHKSFHLHFGQNFSYFSSTLDICSGDVNVFKSVLLASCFFLCVSTYFFSSDDFSSSNRDSQAVYILHTLKHSVLYFNRYLFHH